MTPRFLTDSAGSMLLPHKLTGKDDFREKKQQALIIYEMIFQKTVNILDNLHRLFNTCLQYSVIPS